MAIYQELVDKYYAFYHPEVFKSHNILRPISEVISLTIKSDTEISDEDLMLEMIGKLDSAMDIVRSSKQAKGFVALYGEERRTAIRQFVEYFYKEIFQGYCRGERALLQERANRIKYGCEAYYLETYAPKKKEKQDEQKTDNAED